MAVLIVDDDDSVLAAIKLLLKNEGMEYVACRSPNEALDALREKPIELALVDLNYVEDTTSGKEGLALITAMRDIDGDLPIVAMTGWGTIDVAVAAMKRGAADFIEKPWDDNYRLLNVIRTQIRLEAAQRREKKLSAENALLRDRGEGKELVCKSPAMQKLLAMAQRVATSSLPVLIIGENGTGKGVLAEYIHAHSARAQGPFISVNMGALAEGTFESEMFGHTKGAFTDAKAARIGRVELAEDGTLFMDEIANLPLTQQAKILRLLEDKLYERLGSSQTKRADIRVISATNADLQTLVAEKGFRQDLLYRLNGVTLQVPPLRERREDILELARSFLANTRQRYNSQARGFSAGACVSLEKYAWPGNVRELQHVVERSVLLAQEEEIQHSDLQLPEQATTGTDSHLEGMSLDEAEIWLIRQALRRNSGNAGEAARALGISRSALYRRLGKREPE